MSTMPGDRGLGIEPEADLPRMVALVLSQREAVPVAERGIEQHVGVWCVVRTLARHAVGVPWRRETGRLGVRP